MLGPDRALRRIESAERWLDVDRNAA
jgi:hypothetical protein